MSSRDAAVRPITQATSMPASQSTTLRLVGLVLLPFVTGYFLSYFFRTVNAVLAARLSAELSLSAAELGLVTAAYFLMAAVAQLPLGWALDRHGPRRVQVVCLVIAAAGAALFSRAVDVQSMFVARALIGLGVASALMAGLKAMAMVCAPSRLGLFNGIYMCIGALGAVAASMPTEHLLQSLHWRDLFVALALACLAAAALIALVVPKLSLGGPAATSQQQALGYRDIFRDPHFWRLAPLSATAIGTAWALQGLWSAPWLRDVGHLTPPEIANHLLVMALALSLGALSFGIILQFLSRRGIPAAWSMAFAALTFLVAELGLALAWPISPLGAWCVVSAFAAATVLTYTMSAQHFPKESVGRANSAFNLLHFIAAFSVQSLFGTIVARWPRDALGHYPPEAYKAAILCLAAVQLVALLWFLQPVREAGAGRPVSSGGVHKVSQSAAWLLLLWVGYQGIGPPHDRLGGALQNLLAPRVTAIVENAAASPITALQSRIATLETLIQDRDLELAALRRDFERLQSSERAGQDRSQELAASLGYLHEGIGILLDRIEELERKQN